MVKTQEKVVRTSSKKYSISYKYKTGMDEPEIRYSGDVDQDTFDNFISEVHPDHSDQHPQDPFVKDSSSLIKNTNPNDYIKEFSENFTISSTIEGIPEENIKIFVLGNFVSIRGKSEDGTRKYRRKVNLPAKVHSKIVKRAYRDGVLKIRLKKKVQ